MNLDKAISLLNNSKPVYVILFVAENSAEIEKRYINEIVVSATGGIKVDFSDYVVELTEIYQYFYEASRELERFFKAEDELK